MSPAVGQRWLWKFGSISEVVVEVSQIDYGSNYVELLYVQIIKCGCVQDRFGYKEDIHISRFSGTWRSENFTYLKGQDK
jgi:hypothetical protein